MNFKQFNAAVAKQFLAMTSTGLFTVAIDKELLWETYLGSFPEGTNSIYKTRREYDCTCCRHFIRTLGGVVTIVDGKLVSIWDFTINDNAFQTVANSLSALVKSCAIDNVFLRSEKTAGTAKSLQLLEDKSVKTWEHFFVHLPTDVIVKKDELGPKSAEALEELIADALDEVPPLGVADSCGGYSMKRVQGSAPITRAEMESRRLRAVDLFTGGTHQAAVAHTLGVSRTSASRWYRHWKSGRGMTQRKATGRPRRFDWVSHNDELREMHRSKSKWTAAEFTAAIQDRWGVRYDPDHVIRIMYKLGLRKARSKGVVVEAAAQPVIGPTEVNL